MTYYVVKAYKDYHYPFLIENEDRRNAYGEVFDKSVVFKGTKEECESIVTPINSKIAKLEAQIEKMKCCEMCKHKNLNWEFSPICEARDKIIIENPLTCKCDKWSM